MRNFLKRLSSRKFQAALSVVATGVVMIFTGMEQDPATAQVQIVAGSSMAAIAAVVYVWRESKLDLAHMTDAAEPDPKEE